MIAIAGCDLELRYSCNEVTRTYSNVIIYRSENIHKGTHTL